MHPTTIRSAVLSDAIRIAELAGTLGYPSHSGVIAERLTRLLPRDDHAVLVAVNPDGTLTGWIHGSEHLLVEAEQRCEILGLVVDSGHRGQGIGRQLVEALESWARSRGLPMVGVRSNVIRLESHPFYERMGYVRTKTQHSYRKSLT